MSHRTLLLVAAASAAAFLTLAPPVAAVWPVNPATNLPVCTAAGRQDSPVAIAPDGSGGAFITWTDFRAGSADIYVQHVSGGGYADPLWPVNGLAVITLGRDQLNPSAVSDGAGGVVLMWEDDRNGSGLRPLCASHVLANGTLDAGWGVNGRLLSGYNAHVEFGRCASDGAGGLLATWAEPRGAASHDIYAQRIPAAGTLAWGANGLLVCGATDAQYEPVLCSDLAGGAIVAWNDYRKGASDPDIYAARVLANGTMDSRWAANGVGVCTVTGAQAYVGLLSDGAGGAFLAWVDSRTSPPSVFAHHVRADGTLDPAWPADGRQVHSSAANGRPALESDGAGGIVLLSTDSLPVVHHVLAGGNLDPTWPVGGVHLPDVNNPVAASDGAGGLVIVAEDYWTYYGSNYPALTAWRVRSTGVFDPAWPAAGGIVSGMTNVPKHLPRVVTDGAGGAIVAWTDGRNLATTDYDEYAQRIRSNGTLGAPAPLITGAQDVRGDQGGRLLLTWMASEGDAAPNPYVGDYHVWRRIQADVAVARAAPVTARSPGAAPSPGDVREQPGATGSTWWEFIATVPASRLPYYALLVSTTADSLPGAIPWNVFVVDAEDATTWAFYSSPADSGYSADNVAPGLTAPAFGQYSQGFTLLHWAPNPAPDLLEYRLYRSQQLNFTPGPANFVAAVRDTHYLDMSGLPFYYILHAVDVHGNAGTNGLILPDGALDAGGAAPKALAFGGARPNPARGAAEFAFDLPSPAAVRIAVFDVSGRRVRELAASLPAGSHRLAWDGRDASGATSPAGLYLARFEAQGVTRVARFVLTR